ncbi:MAG: hypothetical protein ACRD36_13050, partial [Candidatus Acidiferrum sp.]
LLPFGGVQSMLLNTSGMRAVPVNGAVYCFEAKTGQLNWWRVVPNQMLVLERFGELPFALFASQYQKFPGAGRVTVHVANIMAVHTRTGKLFYLRKNSPQQMGFYSLNIDGKNGRIELVGYQLRITFLINPLLAVNKKSENAQKGGAELREAVLSSDR